MIHWLVQSITAHPDLERGVAPEGLLSPAEQAHLDSLAVEKRRREWLLGRWTAKHLLRSYIEQQTGIQPALSTLTIANDSSGAPYVSMAPGWSRSAVSGGPYRELWTKPTIALSISHRDHFAFCAMCVARGVQIGADMERIEARSWQFVEDYFTPTEVAQVRRAPAGLRDTMVTAIWSAKEAVLKALSLGLTVDTRRVRCEFGAPQALGQLADWADIHLSFEAEPRAGRVPAADERYTLSGWWRVYEGYVLTMSTWQGAAGQGK